VLCGETSGLHIDDGDVEIGRSENAETIHVRSRYVQDPILPPESEAWRGLPYAVGATPLSSSTVRKPPLHGGAQGASGRESAKRRRSDYRVRDTVVLSYAESTPGIEVGRVAEPS
jgi:hypothetical protein